MYRRFPWASFCSAERGTQGVEDGLALGGEAAQDQHDLGGDGVNDVAELLVVDDQVQELRDLEAVHRDRRLGVRGDDQVGLLRVLVEVQVPGGDAVDAAAAEGGSVQARPDQAHEAQVGTHERRPAEVGFVQVRAVEVGPPAVGSAQGGAVEVGTHQPGPGQVRPVQVGFRESGFDQSGVLQNGPGQVGPVQVRLLQTRPGQIHGCLQVVPPPQVPSLRAALQDRKLLFVRHRAASVCRGNPALPTACLFRTSAPNSCRSGVEAGNGGGAW